MAILGFRPLPHHHRNQLLFEALGGHETQSPKSGLPALRIHLHRLSSRRLLGLCGRRHMRIKLGMLLAGSALMATPAGAQNAAGLLQAADKAIGASAVNSVVYAGTGWMGAV